MNLEEKVKREHWFVLQELKEESYRVRSGEQIKHWIRFDFYGGDPAPSNQIQALEKLEELGAIRILNPGGTGEYE